MGTVFRALDVTTQRHVAVKVMRPEHAADGALVERFLRESKAASLVRHPHVVEVLGHGQSASDTLFIVHELLEGKTLALHLKQAGALSPGAALRLLSPVVEAMAHAHASGVIHRDLNPSNIFLSVPRGERRTVPKVLDFGISKIRADISGTASASGMAMGTPAYMSPEQVRGLRSVDTRADVWAIGVVLFEMLAGRLPFGAKETSSMFVEICTTRAPRLDTVVPGTPALLAALVERCLEPKPEDRFANAEGVLDALRQATGGALLANDVGAQPTAVPRSRMRPLPWLLAALVLLALLALAVARSDALLHHVGIERAR
jgi:serine/threonine-protein kinase